MCFYSPKKIMEKDAGKVKEHDIMVVSTKLLKMQLALFKSFVDGCNIETMRFAQNKIGKLMAKANKDKVCYKKKIFPKFAGEWIMPKIKKLDGVILYLHGGGYVAGDLEYSKGLGTALSAKNGIRVFCPAYRLAPENPFPAALEDALCSYKYLIKLGYTKKIVLCGESAGGGLIYSLCLKLKDLKMPLPKGIIGISPWADLTSSGKSYEENKKNDPSMTKERLKFYASMYSKDLKNPYVSPVFGDLSSLPKSLNFVGESEVMLDDAKMLHKKLLEYGCKSELVVKHSMWHVYILYGVKESKDDYSKISRFLMEVLNEKQ
ncbi:MAG: alpha/beta hydrolase [Bacillota bacterium]|nr:alpha/beta hydrolase [Bacillota bacterium]